MLATRINAPHAARWGALLALSLALAFAIPEPFALVFRFPWTVFEGRGSIESIGAAVVVPLIYWLGLPTDWRMAGLLLISLLMPLLVGVSAAFVPLIVALALMTHTAARQPTAPQSVARQTAFLHFLYAIFFTTLLALATINQSIFEVPAVVLLTAGAATFILVDAVLHQSWDLPGITLAKWAITAYLLTGLVGEARQMQAALPLAIALYGALALIAALQSIASVQFRRLFRKAVVVFLLIGLVLLKTPGTVTLVGWIGFSYIAFRLLHIILDAFNGQHTDASAPELLLYTLFFPALLVGPIDRLPRFLQDRRSDGQPFYWVFAVEGTLRVLRGCAIKFFLADALLAPIALGVSTAPGSNTAFAWIQLYFYAFYIFCDFAGYVDIALGSARLLGYKLPENFNAPYLKSSITEFWQSWHITLSNWLRTYVFIPMSRRLMQTRLKRWPLLVVFVAQMTTMVLIGLWHGVTLNFVIWGGWHGAGLFVHKVYSDRTRRYYLRWKQTFPLAIRLLSAAGVLLTFHFVLLGWVFFALPTPEDARRFFVVLLGGHP